MLKVREPREGQLQVEPGAVIGEPVRHLVIAARGWCAPVKGMVGDPNNLGGDQELHWLNGRDDGLDFPRLKDGTLCQIIEVYIGNKEIFVGETGFNRPVEQPKLGRLGLTSTPMGGAIKWVLL